MAGIATPIFPQVLQNTSQTYQPSDGNTIKTIITAGTNGTKVEWLAISSTDTVARDLQFWLNDGTTNYLLTTISIPANSGFTTAIAALSFFSSTQITMPSYDMNGNRYFYLKSGWSLVAGILGTSVSGSKTITITAQGANF